jgi:hypothetical protein
MNPFSPVSRDECGRPLIFVRERSVAENPDSVTFEGKNART